MRCPNCDSPRIRAQYTQPPRYECKECRAILRDSNDLGIPTLTEQESKQKRPALYGLPVCTHCTHAPHPEGPCSLCEKEQTPREVTLEMTGE